MELAVLMKTSWSIKEPTYVVQEDNTDLTAYVHLKPIEGNTICLDVNGVQDLIDVLTMLKQRMT